MDEPLINFRIDDDPEIDPRSFVAGYEAAVCVTTARAMVALGLRGTLPQYVHSPNAARVVRMLGDLGIRATWKMRHDDWADVIVAKDQGDGDGGT